MSSLLLFLGRQMGRGAARDFQRVLKLVLQWVEELRQRVEASEKRVIFLRRNFSRIDKRTADVSRRGNGTDRDVILEKAVEILKAAHNSGDARDSRSSFGRCGKCPDFDNGYPI